MVGNLRTRPQYVCAEAVGHEIDSHRSYHGRDSVVRWFPFDNLDPRGITSCEYVFDWRNTDDAAAHFVTFIHSGKTRQAYVNVGWDDGIVMRLGDKVVFEEVNYPVRGHGLLFRDRYIFEKRVPVTIPKGRTKLAVTSLNSHGNWLFSLRITDVEGIPFDDVRFRLDQNEDKHLPVTRVRRLVRRCSEDRKEARELPQHGLAGTSI